eukprot:c34444_g1_i1 orf=64-282(+)
MENAQVHWFSILNSLMVMNFLVGIVLVIFLRTICHGLTKYQGLDKEAASSNDRGTFWMEIGGGGCFSSSTTY